MFLFSFLWYNSVKTLSDILLLPLCFSWLVFGAGVRSGRDTLGWPMGNGWPNGGSWYRGIPRQQKTEKWRCCTDSFTLLCCSRSSRSPPVANLVTVELRQPCDGVQSIHTAGYIYILLLLFWHERTSLLLHSFSQVGPSPFFLYDSMIKDKSQSFAHKIRLRMNNVSPTRPKE